MIKQDIDQSYTSWLIYSDYLEENNQLNLAEQIRFELDYKLFNGPPPYGDYSDYSNVGSLSIGGNRDVGGGYSGNASDLVGSNVGVGDVSEHFSYPGGHYYE